MRREENDFIFVDYSFVYNSGQKIYGKLSKISFVIFLGILSMNQLKLMALKGQNTIF